MGSGKSTAGRKLSSAADMNFIDLDNYIEKKTEQSITEIFEKKGQDHFRRIENHCLKEIINKDNFVLSCGGGTPCFFNNMSLMNKNGVTIYLEMDVNDLYYRIKQSQDTRPLVKEMSDNSLLNFISSSLKEREKFYKMAHHTVNAINLDVSALTKLIS